MHLSRSTVLALVVVSGVALLALLVLTEILAVRVEYQLGIFFVAVILDLGLLLFVGWKGGREPKTHVLGRRTARRLRKLEGEHLRTSALDSRPKF